MHFLRKIILALGRVIHGLHLELWTALVFAAFFFIAIRSGQANVQIGWIAFAIYIAIVCIHQWTRQKKEDEIARAGAEVNKSKKRLLAMADVKNRFLATISHELRTPLTAIQEATNLLADGVADAPSKRQTHLLNITKRNVVRLSTLLNDLLDLSHLETEGLKATLSEVSMEEMVSEAIAVARPIADTKKVTLDSEIPRDIPSVLVDRKRVVQVIGELIDNAVKFTQGGGRVGVSVRFIPTPEQVELCVWDTGAGMSEKTLRNIFSPRAEVDRKEDYVTPGAGLGLALCREIVTQLGGSIWAESTPGKGSAMFFTMRAYSDEALLESHFAGAVREASFKKMAAHYLTIRVKDYARMCKAHGPVAMQRALEDMKTLVKGKIRAEDRLATEVPQGQLHLFMVGSGKDMLTRISNIDRFLSGKTFDTSRGGFNLEFLYALVHYPDDGDRLKTLRMRAEELMRSGGTDLDRVSMEGAA